MLKKEIYNIKQGVCEHFTLLYNTLLTAIGIKAIKISGVAKNITENNIKVEEKKDNEDNDNNNPTEKHGWTLAKIDGQWVPLDSTWDLLDKKVPVTHVFQNYGDFKTYIVYNVDNKMTDIQESSPFNINISSTKPFKYCLDEPDNDFCLLKYKKRLIQIL